MRLKGAREVFVQNLLFTKKMALDAALDVTKRAHYKAEAMAPILDKTAAVLASDDKGIYSEQIRQNQLKEIDLLMEHYGRLLRACGDNYDASVIHAYSHETDYRDFLELLSAAERDVNRAAVETLGKRADTEMLSRIERASHRIRMKAAERIFAASGRKENA